MPTYNFNAPPQFDNPYSELNNTNAYDLYDKTIPNALGNAANATLGAEILSKIPGVAEMGGPVLAGLSRVSLPLFLASTAYQTGRVAKQPEIEASHIHNPLDALLNPPAGLAAYNFALSKMYNNQTDPITAEYLRRKLFLMMNQSPTIQEQF